MRTNNQNKPPLDPRNKLIIYRKTGFFKTLTKKRTFVKFQGKKDGVKRVSRAYHENFGMTESIRCFSLADAQNRMKFEDARATYWNEDRQPFDVSNNFIPDAPGINNGLQKIHIQNPANSRPISAKYKRIRQIKRKSRFVAVYKKGFAIINGRRIKKKLPMTKTKW